MSDWEEIPTPSHHDDWEEVKPLELQDKPSMLESGARGAAQGATLGFADEISGGAEALWHKAKGDPKAFGELYEKARDESRSNFKAAKDANPWTYGAGEVGGGLATALAGGAPATLGRAVILGAGVGGAAGVGSSEAHDWQGVTEDGLKGAAIGGAGGAAGYGAGKVIPWASKTAGDKLKAIAEMRAFKALGPTKAATEEAFKRGNASAIGRDMLDSGVVTPLASKQTMLNRVGGLVDDSAKELDSTLKNVTSLQNAVSPEDAMRLEGARFSPQELAEKLKDQIRQEYSHLPEEVVAPRLKQVDMWLNKSGRMDATDAQAFKTQMQKFIKDGSYLKENPGASQETLLGIRKGIKEGIERNGDEAAKILGENGGQIRDINQKFGGRLGAQDILEDRVARDATNRTFSLTDYVAMAAANPLGAAKAVAAGVGNKVAREKGSQLIATGADKASKFLLQSPRMQQLAAANPAAFRALSQKLAGPEVMSKVAGQSETPDFVSQPIDEHEAKKNFLEGN